MSRDQVSHGPPMASLLSGTSRKGAAFQSLKPLAVVAVLCAAPRASTVRTLGGKLPSFILHIEDPLVSLESLMGNELCVKR